MDEAPEPPHLRRLLVVSIVPGVCPPVVDVDGGDSAEEARKLRSGEVLQELEGNDLEQAVSHRLDRRGFRDAIQLVPGVEPDVLVLVEIRDGFFGAPGTSSVSVRVVVAAVVVVVATPPGFSSAVDVVRSTTSSLLALVAGRGSPSVFAVTNSTARVSQSVLLPRSTRYSDSSIVRTLSTCMLPDRQSETCAWSCWRTQCAIRFSIGLSDGICSSRRHDHQISGSSFSPPRRRPRGPPTTPPGAYFPPPRPRT